MMRFLNVIVAASLTIGADAQVVIVSDHRPMARMLDSLEILLNVPIHYEDPQYSYAGDLEDVANQEMRSRVGRDDFKIFVPRRATFTVRQLSTAFPSELERVSQVREAIDSFSSTGLSHLYTLDTSGGVLYVIPKASADKHGRLQPVMSVMSERVTIPSRTLAVHEAINVLLQSVSDSKGAKVVLGQAPIWAGRMVTIKSDGEEARIVLRRILEAAAPSQPLSYRLLYDPTVKYYMLNLQTLGGQRSTLAPVTRPSVEGQTNTTGAAWFKK